MAKYYAVKIKDEKTREKSQSGGAFTLLSDYILENNGIVYGCYLTEDFEVKYLRAESKETRDKMLLSKYVQSNLYNTFLEIKEDLKKNQKVMFVGTPCHTAGLLSFLETAKIDNNNLVTVDIVCHGVPSQKVWKTSINWLQNKFKNINDYKFRDKQYGWRSSNTTFLLKNKKHKENSFNTLFYKHYLIRPSCFECKFRNLDRKSDIIIGDCWGDSSKYSDFFDNKGISLLICNSEKGEQIFKSICKNCDFITIDISDFMQPALKENYNYPKKYTKFWKQYKTKGYEYVAKKYGERNLIGYAKRIVKKIIKK